MARSRPTVVVGPWPGSTTISSGRGRNREASEASISVVDPPGRSVRPIEPANTRSPASSCPGWPPSSAERKVTCPGVWPGVWSTTRRTPASSTTWPSASSRTSSGSCRVSPPKAARDSGPNPARGSVSRCRSAGWTKAGMPWAPASGATVQTWSRWPWVSRAATGLRRWRRHSSSMPARASWPGSTTRASEPGAVATSQQFVWKVPAGNPVTSMGGMLPERVPPSPRVIDRLGASLEREGMGCRSRRASGSWTGSGPGGRPSGSRRGGAGRCSPTAGWRWSWSWPRWPAGCG